MRRASALLAGVVLAGLSGAGVAIFSTFGATANPFSGPFSSSTGSAAVRTGEDFVTVGLGEDVSFEKVVIAGNSTSAEALTVLRGKIRMAPSTVNANALFYWSDSNGFNFDNQVNLAAGQYLVTDNIVPKQAASSLTLAGAHGVTFAPQTAVDACVSGLKGQVTTLSSDGELYACDGTTSARLQRTLWSAVTSIDVGDLASHAVESHNVTVTGATTADLPTCRPVTAPTTDIDAHEYISAADTVTIVFHNDSGGNVNPAATDWQCKVDVR